jgi:hypothetical protein
MEPHTGHCSLHQDRLFAPHSLQVQTSVKASGCMVWCDVNVACESWSLTYSQLGHWLFQSTFSVPQLGQIQRSLKGMAWYPEDDGNSGYCAVHMME